MISELHTPDPIESTAHLSLVHPSLATLEATMIDQENRVNIATEANHKGRQAEEGLASTQWAQRIEAAVEKPEELAIIRRKYDESALQFVSTWLNWTAARGKMMEGRSIISGVIVDTIIAFEQLDHHQKVALRSIFEARLVAARELHGRNVTEKVIPHHSAHKNRVEVEWLDPSSKLLELADKIQAHAFRAMAAGLPSNLRHDVYTTSFAVGDKSRANASNPDGFECRHLEPVAFVDCVNSTHPESARLAELLSLVKNASSRCATHDNAYTHQQKGQINERQHSDRLVKFLHADFAQESTCGRVETLEEQIAAQNQRRYDFESVRQEFALNVRYFRDLLTAIVAALKAATEETEAFLTQVEGQSRTTVDQYETLRIMLNNCLAADVLLRRCVQRLLSDERKIREDISSGAGARVMKSSFDDVFKHYAHQVQRRKEELGHGSETVAKA